MWLGEIFLPPHETRRDAFDISTIMQNCATICRELPSPCTRTLVVPGSTKGRGPTLSPPGPLAQNEMAISPLKALKNLRPCISLLGDILDWHCIGDDAGRPQSQSQSGPDFFSHLWSSALTLVGLGKESKLAFLEAAMRRLEGCAWAKIPLPPTNHTQR